MSEDEAKDRVRAIHKGDLTVALNRLVEFDTLLLRKLNAKAVPPNLLQNIQPDWIKLVFLL
jgi:hypothetical protein